MSTDLETVWSSAKPKARGAIEQKSTLARLRGMSNENHNIEVIKEVKAI
jgi:hypothetical protein